MKKVYLFLVIYFYGIFASDNEVIKLFAVGGDQPVTLGSTVAFKCNVNKQLANSNFSVVFQHHSDIMAETCESFKAPEYTVTCESRPNRDGSQTYSFTIKSVIWNDRGQWSCLISAHRSTYFLHVIAPPRMAPIEVDRKSISTSSTSNGNAGVLQPSVTYPISSQHVEFQPSSHHSRMAIGRGTRTNPYDLRSDVTLQFTCKTECSYPNVSIEWTTTNVTNMQARKLVSKTETRHCKDFETRGMTVAIAPLTMNCDTFNLIGLNKVRCSVAGDTDISGVSKYVYVLCSGGEIPLMLTGGEMIGLAVAAIVIFVLIIAACMLLRKQSKGQNGRNSRGQLV